MAYTYYADPDAANSWVANTSGGQSWSQDYNPFYSRGEQGSYDVNANWQGAGWYNPTQVGDGEYASTRWDYMAGDPNQTAPSTAKYMQSNEWAGAAAGRPSGYYDFSGSGDPTYLGTDNPNEQASLGATGGWKYNPVTKKWAPMMPGDTSVGAMDGYISGGSLDSGEGEPARWTNTRDRIYGGVMNPTQFYEKFYDPYVGKVEGLRAPDEFLGDALMMRTQSYANAGGQGFTNSSTYDPRYAGVMAGSDDPLQAGRANNPLTDTLSILNAYMNQDALKNVRGGSTWDWSQVPELQTAYDQGQARAKAQAQQIHDTNTKGMDWAELGMGALGVFGAPLAGIAMGGFNPVQMFASKLAGMTGIPGLGSLGSLTGALDGLVGGAAGSMPGMTSEIGNAMAAAGDSGLASGATGMDDFDIFGGADMDWGGGYDMPAMDMGGLDNFDLMGDLGSLGGGLTDADFGNFDMGYGTTGTDNPLISNEGGMDAGGAIQTFPMDSAGGMGGLMTTLSQMGSMGMTIAKMLGIGGGGTSGSGGLMPRTGTSGGTSGSGGGVYGGAGGTAGGSMGGLLQALLQYQAAGDQEDDLKAMMERAVGQADRFAPHRAESGNMLMQTFNDPLSIYNSDAYQLLDQRMQAQQMGRDAQAGQLFNAPERLAQRQTGFLDHLDKMRTQLQPMAATGDKGASDVITKFALPIAAANMGKYGAVGFGADQGLSLLNQVLGGGTSGGGGGGLDLSTILSIFSGGGGGGGMATWGDSNATNA